MWDNLYDYLGCDPIFDELNAFGRANKARLEAQPSPTGDPDPDQIEAAFQALDDALDGEGTAPVSTFSVVSEDDDDWDQPFPDYSED